MFISKAFAQDATITVGEVTGAAGDPAAMTGSAVSWNIGLVVVMVAMFYLLLIRPQRKRFQEHADMLRALKRGDKVVTAGGLIGVVESIDEEKDEAVVDLGNGLKVTALRSTIQTKVEKETNKK